MSTIAFADRQVIRPAAVITTSTLSTAVWAPRHTTERYKPTCLFASRLQLSSLHAPSARRTPRPPALGRSSAHLPQVHIELPHPGCSSRSGRRATCRRGAELFWQHPGASGFDLGNPVPRTTHPSRCRYSEAPLPLFLPSKLGQARTIPPHQHQQLPKLG